MSHCYRSRCCYGEPTCIARLVQFEVVAVSIQPRPHHIQHLNKVTVGRGCSVVSAKWLEHVEVCAPTSTERVHFYSCDEGRDLMNKVICFIDRQSTHHHHLFV